ncbi:hypothetical protein HMPREF9078_02155 [Capnocytophaga sp. oral taxon 380 str. F0488]|nr:hypothetical protein HMPREF9078_02155 [Capnocytophaga sp. oral taxon 380 str. F0488]
MQRYGVISNLTNKEKSKRCGRWNIVKNQEVIRRSFESKATVRRKKVRSRWLSQRGKDNESGVIILKGGKKLNSF